jgi:16S rRNA (adenine1518-N6/adenine1519-N6)-dimethyltransferase
MGSRRKTPSGFLRLQPGGSGQPTLPEGKRLRERLREYGVRPRKRWGQSFLIRDQIAERIVDASRVADDQVVVEIGPGAGALTGYLAARARKVVAVEKDRRLAALLRDDLGDWSKVQILESDFLQVDLHALALEEDVERLTIVGNLPYSITTPILTRLIESRDVLDSALVLVQREYALRLAAAAGTSDYGSLTVYARFFLTLEPLFIVPPSAFWPKPEVESRLVRIRFRRRPPVQIPDEKRFFALVRAGFGQRRKTLANALADAFEGDKQMAGRVLKVAGIAPTRRGETLDLDEFGRLARADNKVWDHDRKDES